MVTLKFLSTEPRIYASTADPIKLQEIEYAYKQAITHYPLDFLKHRTMNFFMLMKNWGFYHYAFIELNEAQKHGMDIKKFYINNKQSNSPEKVILAYIVAISIVFLIVLFFATMACDYRYYYVIRILTLFSLPIYLKFRAMTSRAFKLDPIYLIPFFPQLGNLFFGL